jgi:hypothetical protein
MIRVQVFSARAKNLEGFKNTKCLFIAWPWLGFVAFSGKCKKKWPASGLRLLHMNSRVVLKTAV